MRKLRNKELKIISGGSDRDAAMAIGAIIGGTIGESSGIPYAGGYGGAVGGYLAGAGYDAVVNSPTITIPSGFTSDPFNMGSPSYLNTGNDSYFSN